MRFLKLLAICALFAAVLIVPRGASAQYCGDGFCNGSETACPPTACTQDCGVCNPPPQEPYGYHEGADGPSCSTSGWALNPNIPNTSINVRIYDGDRDGGGSYLGQFLANDPRPDVNIVTGLPGNHGFSVSFSATNPNQAQLFSGTQHMLYAYAQGGINPKLSTSPQPITCPVAAGTISGSPNPCQGNPGDASCSSTITFNSTNARNPQVWVFAGAPDCGAGDFANAASGSYVAPWIGGTPLTFYLYENGCGSTVLAQTTVTGLFYPQVDDVTIAPLNPPPNATVTPDGLHNYLITITSSDVDGGNDIGSEYALINYQGPNADPPNYTTTRGYIGWSVTNFPYWCGAANCGSPTNTYGPVVNCSSGGGQAATYNGLGPQYINIVDCATVVVGNTRYAYFNVTFNPVFTTPLTTNTLSGWADDWGGLFSAWTQKNSFDLTKYTIQGAVFLDTNGDGSSAGDSGYQNATLTLGGVGAQNTDGSGNFSFSLLPAGTYNLNLTMPAGYSLTGQVSNAPNVTVGPDAAVNFGLYPNAPVCAGGVAAAPASIAPGGSSALSVGVCSPTIPAPSYSWPPLAAGCGSISGAGSSVTYNAPATSCGGICAVTVNVTNTTGTTPYSTNITLSAKNTVSGTVLVDDGANNCSSGASAYGGSGTVVVTDSLGNQTTSGAVNAGTYTATDVQACGQKTATLQGIGQFHVEQVFDGSWKNPTSGNSYTFTFNSDHALNWCITDTVPWIQSTTGDVRYNAVSNRLPAANVYASSDASNPSVFYSSANSGDFGSYGGASTVGWKVDDEYGYQSKSQNKNGTISYSYYTSKIANQEISTVEVPGCSAGPCTTDINAGNAPATGIYVHQGDLTINSYSHRAGAKVLILASGNVTIGGNIAVPAGGLLIIAAKGTLTINKSVTSVDGIFTSEGSVITDGITNPGIGGCGAAAADTTLTVNGTLVANSVKPFNLSGAGQVINYRSLCLNNKTTPSVIIAQRLNFVTQLTDIYKSAITRWKEVNP